MPLLNFAIDGKQAESGAQRVNNSLDSIASKSKSLISTAINPLTVAIGGIVSYQTGAKLIESADKYTTMAAQLKYVTGNSIDAARAQNLLYEMSQKTGTSVTENAQALLRFNNAQEMTGFTTQENIEIIGGLNALMIKTGTSGASATAAMMQLGQSLAAGTLQGDEFRSIMENAPALMQAMAKSMGVGMGELKKLASEGKINSQVMATALKGIAAEGKLTFDELPKTASSGWQKVVNAFETAWARINNDSGIMSFIYDALIDLVGWIEENAPAFSLWLQGMVQSLQQNWPIIRTQIDEITTKIAGMIASAIEKMPTMEETFNSLAQTVNDAGWIIQETIGLIDSLMAKWESFKGMANYLPIMGAARAAGTIAGGGSVGDAYDAFFDADNSMINQPAQKRALGGGTSITNNFNQNIGKNEIDHILAMQTLQGARL